jgi:hypothetical protein
MPAWPLADSEVLEVRSESEAVLESDEAGLAICYSAEVQDHASHKALSLANRGIVKCSTEISNPRSDLALIDGHDPDTASDTG